MNVMTAMPSNKCLVSDATTGIAISSNIEAGLGITAGSLIMLRPLIRWLRCISHSLVVKVRGLRCNFRLSNSNHTQSRPFRYKHSPPEHWQSAMESGNARAAVSSFADSRDL
jgi:cation-transporting ATPase 13A1